MLATAIKQEILSSRALDYRRIVIAAGTVLLLLYIAPNLDFSGLSFFGIKPSSGQADAKALIFASVWAVLVYHFIFFAYYAWRDFRIWWKEASESNTTRPGPRQYFPEIGMFFGKGPESMENAWQSTGGWKAENWKFDLQKDQKQATWVPIPPEDKVGRYLETYAIPATLYQEFRERFRWFKYIDVGIPLGATTAPFIAMICRNWQIVC